MSNPSLPAAERDALVRALMDARRDVASARRAGDRELLRAARRRVQLAKEGLGERGAVWWDDGSPDFNRHMAINTPYRDWYEALAVE